MLCLLSLQTSQSPPGRASHAKQIQCRANFSQTVCPSTLKMCMCNEFIKWIYMYYTSRWSCLHCPWRRDQLLPWPFVPGKEVMPWIQSRNVFMLMFNGILPHNAHPTVPLFLPWVACRPEQEPLWGHNPKPGQACLRLFCSLQSPQTCRCS